MNTENGITSRFGNGMRSLQTWLPAFPIPKFHVYEHNYLPCLSFWDKGAFGQLSARFKALCEATLPYSLVASRKEKATISLKFSIEASFQSAQQELPHLGPYCQPRSHWATRCRLEMSGHQLQNRRKADWPDIREQLFGSCPVRCAALIYSPLVHTAPAHPHFCVLPGCRHQALSPLSSRPHPWATPPYPLRAKSRLPVKFKVWWTIPLPPVPQPPPLQLIHASRRLYYFRMSLSCVAEEEKVGDEDWALAVKLVNSTGLTRLLASYPRMEFCLMRYAGTCAGQARSICKTCQTRFRIPGPSGLGIPPKGRPDVCKLLP